MSNYQTKIPIPEVIVPDRQFLWWLQKMNIPLDEPITLIFRRHSPHATLTDPAGLVPKRS